MRMKNKTAISLMRRGWGADRGWGLTLFFARLGLVSGGDREGEQTLLSLLPQSPNSCLISRE